MLDEQKVRRMTKMAYYEAHGGKKDKAVSKYFRGDYVGLHLLISFIVITAACLAVVGAYVCFYFDEVMAAIYTIDVTAAAKKALFVYVVVVVVYLTVTYVIYQIRYRKARRRLDLFCGMLDRLFPEEDEKKK